MLLQALHARFVRAGLVTALALGLAAPAAAVTYYEWTTEDGVLAFTDSTKRIPDRYKSAAKRKSSGNLRGYKRYTPAGREAKGAYVDRIGERLAHLRQANVPALPRPVVGMAPGGAQVSLRVPNLRIDLPMSPYTDPVVVEEVWTRPAGGSSTRTIQVVTQGGEVISVIKPLRNDRDISFLPDERHLP